MKVTPGDVVGTRQGWSISKFNNSMRALGATMGNNLLVIAVKEEDVVCVLSPSVGPTWVNLDDRTCYVVR